MSEPACQVSAALPLPGHHQITIHHCLTINCAQCGPAATEDYEVHFETERQLWKWIFQEGWTLRADRSVLCQHHSAVADCAEQGHDWQDWYAPRDPEIHYRYCDRCSHGEERLSPEWEVLT